MGVGIGAPNGNYYRGTIENAPNLPWKGPISVVEKMKRFFPTLRVCGCGRKGCLETYVSATGIKRTIFKLMADSMEESEFRHITFNDLTAEMITKAALNGDPLAIEAYEYTGMLLGHALADAVTITSPEAIFLFGGLAKAGKYIFEPTKKYMEMHMMPVFRNKVKLLPSGIDGKNAAVLGASALVWQSLTGKQM